MLLVPADTLATPVPFNGKGLGGPSYTLFFAAVFFVLRYYTGGGREHIRIIRGDGLDTDVNTGSLGMGLGCFLFGFGFVFLFSKIGPTGAASCQPFTLLLHLPGVPFGELAHAAILALSSTQRGSCVAQNEFQNAFHNLC
jgi:hypothetical protein